MQENFEELSEKLSRTKIQYSTIFEMIFIYKLALLIVIKIC